MRPTLRVEASGRTILEADTRETYQLQDIKDPFGFFLEKLVALRQSGWLTADRPLSFMHCNADVTHNCNLRCKFCFSDFSEATSERMADAVFMKLVQVSPLVDDARVFLSCAFEPYLHPKFTDYLRQLPFSLKSKFFFTTNLAVKRLTVDQVTAMAQANLAYMNISFDSLTPEMFEKIRVNADFEVFRENLDKVAKIFSLWPTSPHIHFITMALRSNRDEIKRLSRYIYNDLGLKPDKVTHQVRMAFGIHHMQQDWAAEEMLSQQEWADLFAELSASEHRIEILNQTYPPHFGGIVGGKTAEAA